jgi:hypothetical protein
MFRTGSIARARSLPFWFDEIFTFHAANQPTISDVWRALANGVDLNPPLNYLLARGAATAGIPAISGVAHTRTTAARTVL